MRYTVLVLLVSILLASSVASAQEGSLNVLHQVWEYSVGSAIQESVDLPGLYIHDLDGDSAGDIIMASSGSLSGYTSIKNSVYVFDSNGSVKWKHGFDDVLRVVNLADLNNDGYIETIVSTGQMLENIQRGQIDVVDKDGSVWRSFGSTRLVQSLDVADLDGDQLDEIVGGSSLNVNVFHSHGTVKWSYVVNAPVGKVKAIDLMGRGVKEVIAGADDLYFFDYTGALIGRQELDEGTTKLKKGVLFMETVNVSSVSFPVVVAVTETNTIYAVAVEKVDWYSGLPTLELNKLWSRRMNSGINAMKLMDVDGDMNEEILIACGDGKVYLLSGSGDMVWEYSLRDSIPYSLDVGDVDGDSINDIVIGSSNGYITALDWRSYFKWRHRLDRELESVTQIAVGDTDNDDFNEIVAGTSGGGVVYFELNMSFTKKQQADNYYNTGQRFFIESEFSEARDALVKARDIYSLIGDSSNVMKCDSIIQKIDERLSEERREMAGVYYNKAQEYFISGDYDKAKDFLLKAKEIYVEFGDQDNILKTELLMLRIENKINTPSTIPLITLPETSTTLPEDSGLDYGKIVVFVLAVLIFIAVLMYLRGRRGGPFGKKEDEDWGETIEVRPPGG